MNRPVSPLPVVDVSAGKKEEIDLSDEVDETLKAFLEADGEQVCVTHVIALTPWSISERNSEVYVDFWGTLCVTYNAFSLFLLFVLRRY